MLKPEQVTTAMLRKILLRAFYSSTEKDTWITVEEGLPCIVGLCLEPERKFIHLRVGYKVPHLEEAEIVAAASRLNAHYFLAKFISAKDSISMTYDLPYAEGLNPATLIRIMRRLAKISAEAYTTIPKPLFETRPEEKPQAQRLH